MNRLVSLGVFWIAMMLALGIAHFAEGYPLATFGFQRSQKTLCTRLIEWILTALAALITGSVIIFFSTFVRDRITHTPAPGIDLARLLPAWVLIPAWITGSFTEEVLFRSYPIERLAHLNGAALPGRLDFDGGLYGLASLWVGLDSRGYGGAARWRDADAVLPMAA
jgi:membrane protease YdiL (CAAX protease family)